MQSFIEDDYAIEGPINSSLGVYLARHTKDESIYSSVIKKIIFKTLSERQLCQQAITDYT